MWVTLKRSQRDVKSLNWTSYEEDITNRRFDEKGENKRGQAIQGAMSAKHVNKVGPQAPCHKNLLGQASTNSAFIVAD